MTDIGALVLAGSGEYTPTMDLADQFLLRLSRGRAVLLIATACAPEGDDVMTKWETMGQAHFRKFGVEAVPVRIRDQDEANIAEHAEKIAEAGFVWFSGGRATYLAEAFHDTACWRALEAANRDGAIVAGASGGLGVLNAHVSDPAIGGPQPPTGLGLASPLRALAHFDRMEARRPEFVERTLSLVQPGQKVVGVDEDTTIVWHDGAWQVVGHKRAVVFEADGSRTTFHNGDRIEILPAPERARSTEPT
jgi:cyanophycinase-like exopeptidase